MADGIQKARALLMTPEAVATSPWAALGAAALAATAAVLMAGVVILGPGVRFQDAPPVSQDLLPNG
ncbi:peptidoglycan-binding protein [Brevundimonas sp. FT23028]|uniref:peptidoglycan-binding protein n=1 Tax=Brevundimonas sp. FT23028 TaxID=3393748 RepID=UPI003B58A0CB